MVSAYLMLLKLIYGSVAQGSVHTADHLPVTLKKAMGTSLYQKINEKVLEGTKVSLVTSSAGCYKWILLTVVGS